MDHLLGLLSIRVQKGVNLAATDHIRGGDPYVVFRLGNQTLKTGVVKNTLNPVWDEVLTLPIFEPITIKMEVYDKDRFSRDDEMGDADLDIKPLIEVLRLRLDDLPNETIIATIKPTRTNCLAEESNITWSKGEVIQNMVLRLRNAVSGEVEVQLGWINVPGSKGL
ncbi:putative C2 domain-containing protein [Helianthus annuus]|uniref:C2 domain-containing protein n=1 Tax=Helianthus annuus TaxID=4232 RepID=A0A251SIS3_HELAN|nr:protein C2-DOMAIN ABA-RELATED 4 [Helianthus annuus]KAF5769571.1 putative C2 domain-containing protein [Helianthus annuus]KAJ0486151.1 putative C2 domain-containing protein [Helianthus annuus]KAJ0656701.1 putative C2 domain-containing protein [Helianthus annuus]KAJ0660303.1 putative C2 domain-containing protein [Helianthus annuus]KAJ0854238.1 putative C2 domain-containing protein [Helianthus annuus]